MSGTGRRVLTRWVPWVAVVVVAVVALVLGSHRPPAHPTLQQRTEALASQVRCPVCVGETVAESSAAPAIAIRHEIRRDLAAGEKPPAVLASIEAAYGPSILEKPQTTGIGLLLWVLPVLAALAGLVGLGAAFVWWHRRQGGPPATEADHLLVAGMLGSLDHPAGDGP
ncbi:MAG TPA: cytochrome c-type biogenesis protein [Acidimicrobiales bacterium]|nr:cytochrome c-type biogenesis protein [Acidimicrobiales bacterium]